MQCPLKSQHLPQKKASLNNDSLALEFVLDLKINLLYIVIKHSVSVFNTGERKFIANQRFYQLKAA